MKIIKNIKIIIEILSEKGFLGINFNLKFIRFSLFNMKINSENIFFE